MNEEPKCKMCNDKGLVGNFYDTMDCPDCKDLPSPAEGVDEVGSEDYEMHDFMEVQKEYFNESGESYKHAFVNSDMPDKMLKLINKLYSEVLTLRKSNGQSRQGGGGKTEWNSVETLPDSNKNVMGLYKTTNGRLIHAVVEYTNGYDIEVDDDDGDGDYNHKEGDDSNYLKEGWYEACEQYSGSYDFVFIRRDVVFWQPLPTKPDTPTNK